MKERGIIFNAEMVRAILDGRKTQTRRVLNARQLKMLDAAAIAGECYPLEVGVEHANSQSYYREWCPFGQPGDRLWVRESCFAEHGANGVTHTVFYSSDCSSKLVQPEEESLWEKLWCYGRGSGGQIVPSIHMPRWASRITLEITGIRVERLSEVSEEDAGKEGYPADPSPFGGRGDKWLWFRQLWDSIYPNQSFKHNPWVWVVEFKRVEDGQP